MSNTVVAAIITVCGTVFVAVVSVITQLLVTRFVVCSEQQRALKQIQLERRSSLQQARHERLTDALADLLAETDPQVNAKLSHSRVVVLIHRAQLALDRTQETEAALCDAINQLGMVLQSYIPYHDEPIETRMGPLKELLAAHAKVADLGSQFLAQQWN